ncbi:MAG: type II toxin-antitoxin system mRNA interferase toxin, RelE/StbE family [Patescibacteria group bacterium]
MIIDFHRNFKKDLNKLPLSCKEQLYERINIFSKDPIHPILNNHQLHGKLKGLRSINITGDIRAVYEQISKDKVLFLTIASHSKLYD